MRAKPSDHVSKLRVLFKKFKQKPVVYSKNSSVYTNVRGLHTKLNLLKH